MNKLLSLAAPAVLLLSSPLAVAGGPVCAHQLARAPLERVVAAPGASPIDGPIAAVGEARVAAGLGALAASLRAVAAAAATSTTSPMCDPDGRPLAGNVGKNAHMCSLDERTAAIAGAAAQVSVAAIAADAAAARLAAPGDGARATAVVTSIEPPRAAPREARR